MCDRLSETQMLRLAEVYKDTDILWRQDSELYKNREARESAYQHIANQMNLPGLGPSEIGKKIKNLRSSYYQELNKISRSIQSGATGENVYKPKVIWFDLVNGFLKHYIHRREYGPNVSENQDVSTYEEPNSPCQTPEDPKQTEDPLEEPQAQVTNVKVEFWQPEQQEVWQNQHPVKRPQNVPIRKTKVQKVIDKLENINQQMQNKKEVEDEFDIFGKYVAMTLRNMPQDVSIMARTELQETLAKIQLRTLRERSNSKELNH